jgi:hypothetical protein
MVMVLDVEQEAPKQLNVILGIRSAFRDGHDREVTVIVILESKADPSMIIFVRKIPIVE